MSIGLEPAAEWSERFDPWVPPPGWPITACQMWQHRRSPTFQPHACSPPAGICQSFRHCSPALLCRLSPHLISLVCKPPRQSAADGVETGLGCLVVVDGAPSRLLTWQHPLPALSRRGSLGVDWPRFRPLPGPQPAAPALNWKARACFDDAGDAETMAWLAAPCQVPPSECMKLTPSGGCWHPNSPPQIKPSATGPGELGLIVPGNGSGQPRNGPGLEPSIGLSAGAQQEDPPNWQHLLVSTDKDSRRSPNCLPLSRTESPLPKLTAQSRLLPRLPRTLGRSSLTLETPRSPLFPPRLRPLLALPHTALPPHP
jgi:hypothetical protein